MPAGSSTFPLTNRQSGGPATTPSAYSPRVHDHVAHPRNRGPVEDANGVGMDENPVCGDVMTVWIRVEDGVVNRTGFEVHGCAPSIAAGSAVTEMILNRTIDEVGGLQPGPIEQALGGLPPGKRHCAQLASRAVRRAVADYQARVQNR